MAGVYLHIPFCKQACTYCNFHFSTNRANINALHGALLSEIELRREELEGPVNTVYFGGGTPSLLSAEQIEQILQKLNDNWALNPDAEITLEANPEDLSLPYLKSLSKMGVNRLSIGIQSFQNSLLRFMNRTHDAQQAERAIENAQTVGFRNISLDLIYGNPSPFQHKFENDIEIVEGFNIQHLSCYALTVEPKTLLYKQVGENPELAPKELQAEKDFKSFQSRMEAWGWEHYELSNSCRPGFQSRHNSAYWKRENYLGIGPSAHSFRGNKRRWNLASNGAFIQKVGAGEVFWEEEVLSAKDQFNELLMCGLRTSMGIELKALEAICDSAQWEAFAEEKVKCLELGLLGEVDRRIFIPRSKLILSDGIISRLFWV